VTETSRVPSGSGPPAPRRIMRPRALRRSDVGVVIGAAASSLALTWLVYERLTRLSGVQGFVLVWFGTFLLLHWLIVRELEGRRMATDRTIAVFIGSIAIGLLIPLLVILSYVVWKGFRYLRPAFFTQDQALVGSSSAATVGGAKHAVIGTLEQVGLAMAVSIPLGMASAVFMNEVGGRMVRPVRVVVDAMSGVPSIVAGLFIFAIWILALHQSFSGIAAAFAMSILMLPTVTRTSVEVLRLVPDGLREASLAVGGTQWRTVWNVVLPTARSGLITAVILGVARVIGETALLIMTAFGASLVNWNPFQGPQQSLPLFVYQSYSINTPGEVARAWTGALVLIAMILFLFAAARLVGRARIGRVTR
jgi:phosphate transport system permease protein